PQVVEGLRNCPGISQLPPDRESLLVERTCGVVVSLIVEHDSQAIESLGDSYLVFQLSRDGQARFVERMGGSIIALGISKSPGAMESRRSGIGLQISIRPFQRQPAPVPSFNEVSTSEPEVQQRAAYAEGDLWISAIASRPLQGGSQIIVLQLEPRLPSLLLP